MKLKPFVRRRISRGRRDFNPEWMKRYQLTLLYVGGAALSAFILLCSLLALRMAVSDYNAAARAGFRIQETRLLVSMTRASAVLMRGTANVESMWDRQALPSAALREQYLANNGQLRVIKDSGRRVYAVATEVSDARPASSFLPLLALMEKQLKPRIVRKRTPGLSANTYFLSVQGDFLAMLLRSESGDAAPLSRLPDALALFRQAWPDVVSLTQAAVAHPQAAPADVIWLAPQLDPLSGELVVRLAQFLFDSDNRPLAIVVATRHPGQLLNGLQNPDDGGEFAILDGQGKLLLTPGAERSAFISRVAATHTVGPPPGVQQTFKDGIFQISKRLAETDWTLVYAYTPYTILAGLKYRLLTISALALVGWLLLWVRIVIFRRDILLPSYERAVRLKESQKLNRVLIHTAPVGLSLLALADGSVIVDNNVMARYAEQAGAPPLHQRMWELYCRASQARADRPSRNRPLVGQELTIGAGTHALTHLLVNFTHVRYRGEAALLCALLDISAQKKKEQKLREARQAADQDNKAKSTFLAIMSHEIRTPLNAIIGCLELMGRSPLSAGQRRRLEIVESSSASLLRIINDVLDVSKVEAGQLTFESIPFRCDQLLQNVRDTFAPLAEAKGLALTCEISPGVAGYFLGDPTRIRQVIANLVSNAIKFTESGHVIVRAAFVQDNERSVVQFEIADTGIGMDPAAVPTLFALYTQADSSIHRRYGGTGLGLPLCQRIVEAAQGHISVNSTPGQGSTFTVRWPLQRAEAPPQVAQAGGAAAAETSDAASALESSDGEPPIQVLVAEDHPATRAMLADQLEQLGFDATIVEDGAKALAALAQRQYDVVLTDIGMPVMDGYALASAIRRQYPGLPVVAMSAHSTPEQEHRSLQSSISTLLVKPVPLAVLGRVLRSHGGRSAPKESDSDKTLAELPITPQVCEAMHAATRETTAAMTDALRAGNADAVLNALHSLSGGFALVGNATLAELCIGLQQLVRSEGLDSFQGLWPAFQQEIEDALGALKA
ncbi:ATP-binding protein [Cupriavidus basilensis]|uniref:Sensory/regulatory protein RpfC n=1 Tax=Cupriavidus basilensis TaxID=68895 RepID=A0A0C4Y8S6_9BURK|nr:ATP-binding protein [Cupriavidus basilensis]AJG19358.1 Signal transduction histidine kinase [Cupriavidus basilensis]